MEQKQVIAYRLEPFTDRPENTIYPSSGSEAVSGTEGVKDQQGGLAGV
jgi:hypothetical protein